MPQIERLSWIAPLSEGQGVTLSDDPRADLFLAENDNALLLGVLYDSQYSTRKAFTIPLRLKERLGHFDVRKLAADDPSALVGAFSQKPALHRFPRKFALLTQRTAVALLENYGGDAGRIWTEASDVADLASRLMALPAFGAEKTNWTIGMLGTLGRLPFDGWQDYRVPPPKRKKA